MVESCMDVTHYTQKRLEDIGLSLVTKPTMNVMGVKMKKPGQIVKKLSQKGMAGKQRGTTFLHPIGNHATNHKKDYR